MGRGWSFAILSAAVFFLSTAGSFFASAQQNSNGAILSLEGHSRWGVIASMSSVEGAIQVGQEFRSVRPRVVRTVNGRFAVIFGPERVDNVERTQQALRDRFGLPADFYLSRGERFLETVWTAEEAGHDAPPITALNSSPVTIESEAEQYPEPPKAAQGPRYDFKGVYVGEPASPGAVERKLGLSCGRAYGGGQVCNGIASIAAATASANVVMSPRGLVQRIWLNFQADRYEDVQAAMDAKFGHPVDREATTVANAFGAKFEQVTSIWKGTGVRVELRRFAGTLDTSSVLFQSDEDIEMLKRVDAKKSGDL